MGDFHSTLLPGLSLRGKWIFQNAKRAKTRWRITYEVQVRGTSTRNVSPNRIKSKWSHKYAFVDLPFFSSFFPLFFFCANCEYHHFFKRLPGRSMRMNVDANWWRLPTIWGTVSPARTAVSIHFLWNHPHIDPRTRILWLVKRPWLWISRGN